jgi:hypothetical protein
MRGKSTLLSLFAVLGALLAAAPLSAQTITTRTSEATRCTTVATAFELNGFTAGYDTIRLFVGFGAPGDSTRIDIPFLDIQTPPTGIVAFSFNFIDLPNTGSSAGATFILIVRDIASGIDVSGAITYNFPALLASFNCAREIVDRMALLNEFECPIADQLRHYLTRAANTTGALRCQLLQAALNCVRQLVRSEVPGGLRNPAVSIDPLLGNFRWRVAPALSESLGRSRSAQAHARLLEDELVDLLATFGC